MQRNLTQLAATAEGNYASAAIAANPSSQSHLPQQTASTNQSIDTTPNTRTELQQPGLTANQNAASAGAEEAIAADTRELTG